MIFVKTPAPPKPPAAPKAKKLPPKPPVPPKPPPKKEVEPSTEFGGALRPEEADTLAQGGIDEDDEESALIDYGPMRPISNKNHLEHETLFLERTPLETIVKHLVSENLGACAMVEEDALRYVSDATEQFLMDTMEDMIRIHQHRSTSVYNRSRAQSTSNPQAQLLALAQLDRSERSKRKADDAFPSVAINNKTAFQRPKISKEDFWLRAKNNPSTVGGLKTGSLFKRMLEAKN